MLTEPQPEPRNLTLEMSQVPPSTVFHLEMCEPHEFRPTSTRPGFDVVLVDPPDPEINRRFYKAVGSPWNWTDRLDWSPDDWRRHVHRKTLKTFVGRLDGAESGYFELERQESGNVQILYFGLLPAYIGKGLGGSLLSSAVEQAWTFPGTSRVWVHTCTNDHEHALDNYRARGFKLLRTEKEPLVE